ncbi:MAG: hypothetical protein R2695_13380 [Acidimicrobiales bacterium]
MPIEIGEGAILMTPSIGIAVGSRVNPARPDDLLARADQAMYRAKKLRLGIEQFDDRQRREVLDRQEVEQALSRRSPTGSSRCITSRSSP